MPKHGPIERDIPLPPVGTRGEDKAPRRKNTHKAEVAERSYTAWQGGEYGAPTSRNALRLAAEAHMDEYYGRTSYGTYYETKRENLMKRLRGMAPKAPDAGT